MKKKTYLFEEVNFSEEFKLEFKETNKLTHELLDFVSEKKITIDSSFKKGEIDLDFLSKNYDRIVVDSLFILMNNQYLKAESLSKNHSNELRRLDSELILQQFISETWNEYRPKSLNRNDPPCVDAYTNCKTVAAAVFTLSVASCTATAAAAAPGASLGGPWGIGALTFGWSACYGAAMINLFSDNNDCSRKFKECYAP